MKSGILNDSVLFAEVLSDLRKNTQREQKSNGTSNESLNGTESMSFNGTQNGSFNGKLNASENGPQNGKLNELQNGKLNGTQNGSLNELQSMSQNGTQNTLNQIRFENDVKRHRNQQKQIYDHKPDEDEMSIWSIEEQRRNSMRCSVVEDSDCFSYLPFRRNQTLNTDRPFEILNSGQKSLNSGQKSFSGLKSLNQGLKSEQEGNFKKLGNNFKESGNDFKGNNFKESGNNFKESRDNFKGNNVKDPRDNFKGNNFKNADFLSNLNQPLFHSGMVSSNNLYEPKFSYLMKKAYNSEHVFSNDGINWNNQPFLGHSFNSNFKSPDYNEDMKKYFHKITSIRKKIFTCEHCNSKFVYKKCLDNHMEKNH